MFSTLLKNTLLGSLVLFTLITLWYFASNVLTVLALVVFALVMCFLTGTLIRLILEGIKND